MPTRPAAWGAAPRTPGATPSAATGPPASASPVLAVAVLALTATAPPTPPAPGGGPSVTDWLSVLFAALSVFIAAAAFVVAWRVGSRQTRLQQQVTRIEQERRDRERRQELSAVLIAAWQPRGDGDTGPELLLSNRGEAAASEITIDITSADDGRPAPAFESGTGRAAVDRLGPDQERPLPIRDFLGGAATVKVTLSWTDGRGPHQESQVLRTG